MLKNKAISQSENPSKISGVTSVIVLSFLGYIASNTSITGGLSPLNVAIVACATLSQGIAVFATSLISYIFNGTATFALPQISSMVAILCLKFIMGDFWKKKSSGVFIAVSSGAIMIVFGTVLTFLDGFAYDKLLLRIAHGILCGCTCYFIITALNIIKKEKVIPISGTAGASLGVIYVLSLATLTSIDISIINIGRVVGILIMLLAIKKYKHIGGAVSGVLTSCGVILCSPVLGKSTMLLACAGLVAGLFCEFGIFATLISFIAANGVGLIAIGITPDAVSMLIDTAIATIIFVVIPSSVWSRILQSIGFSDSSMEVMAETARQKLNFASKSIHDVKSSIIKVSDAMEKKIREQDLAARVCENVCSKCKNCLMCWEENFNEVNTAFYKIEQALNNKGEINISDFPPELSHCVKNNLLVNEFNSSYNEIIYRHRLKHNLKEMQIMLDDQFFAMEEMLDSLGEQLTSYSQADNFLSKKVQIYLNKKGFSNAKACVFLNKHGSLNVEIYIPKSVKIDNAELSVDISSIIERELELPRFSVVGNVTKIELCEKPLYAIDTGAAQQPGKQTEASGDAYEIFSYNNTETYVVLSDGMGSGKRAQLDSLLASSLISRLIRAGIGWSAAIRIINTSMRVKAWEESFATVDISIFNLYTGELKLIKAGGSATYLIRGEQIKKLEASSLPIGIIQDIKPVILSIELRPNDIIISASDGVVEEALESIRKIAVENFQQKADEMAAKMMKTAKHFSQGSHGDDITIVVSKLSLQK